MIILPAIDLKDGKAVRLRRGDFATAHQVADDVEATAAAFSGAGARWIHMVDLDAARSGAESGNRALVKQVAEKSGLQVELGGGIRTCGDVDRAMALGLRRVVIGSAAVSHPEVVAYAVERCSDHIAVGIDALDGKVRVSGWEQDSGLDCLTLARNMEAMGVSCLIFTDISTDGMLQGPSFRALEQLQKAVSCRIVASGGVTTLDDVKRLRDMGLYGAIIGKAYYAGTLSLEEAIREAGDQDAG